MTPRPLPRPLRFLASLWLVLALAPSGPAGAQGLRPGARPPALLGNSGAALPAASASVEAAPSGPFAANYIVAVVNSDPITNQDVRARALRTEQQLKRAGQPLPPRPQLARQVLERLINERAQLQIARDTGVRVDDFTVEQSLQSVARQNQLTLDGLRRQLAAEGVSLEEFRSDLRNEITLTRLRDREVEARIRVSEPEVDQFLAERLAQQNPDAQEINLAQILVRVPEKATPQQTAVLRARAEAAFARALAGEDFATLVREFSDAPERSSGGGMGLRSVERYPAVFMDATRSLETGGIAGVLRTGAGFHVLKVIEKRRPAQTALTMTQTRARHILLRLDAQLTERVALERLNGYRTQVQSGGADFARLARQHSQDGSASDGGNLGWASPGQFVPEFEQVMNGLAPGQIAPPFVSRFGAHLLQVLERRQTALSQSETRELVRAQLRERKMEEAYASWAEDVRNRAYVEYRDPPQ